MNHAAQIFSGLKSVAITVPWYVPATKLPIRCSIENSNSMWMWIMWFGLTLLWKDFHATWSLAFGFKITGESRIINADGFINIHGLKWDICCYFSNNLTGSRKELLHNIDCLFGKRGTRLFPDRFDTRVRTALRSVDWKLLTGDPGKLCAGNLQDIEALTKWSLCGRCYRQTSNIRAHLCRQNCWSFRCSWSITCQRCTNYIIIPDLTPGSNGLGKDNHKKRQ